MNKLKQENQEMFTRYNWAKKANNLLGGLVIKKITYEPHSQWDENQIDGYGICVHLNRSPNQKQFKENITLMIMSDEEGNDVGAIHTNIEDFEVIPSL